MINVYHGYCTIGVGTAHPSNWTESISCTSNCENCMYYRRATPMKVDNTWSHNSYVINKVDHKPKETIERRCRTCGAMFIPKTNAFSEYCSSRCKKKRF